MASKLFEFRLGGGICVPVTATDVEALEAALNSSNFHHASTDDFRVALEAVARGQGVVSFEALLVAVNRTVGVVDRVSVPVVESIFNAQTIPSDADGAILSELCCGLSVLCEGSKSEKLAQAFNMFDGDGDGCLTRRELWKFLRCFLKTLLCLTAAGRGMRASERRQVVDNAIVECAARIFTEADTTAPSRVTFDEFGAWYNDEGHEVLPWLELLDVRKWPNIRLAATNESPAGNTAAEQRAGAAAASAAAAAAAAGGGASAVFRFPLLVDGPDEDMLSIYDRDVENLNMICARTKLYTLPPARIHEVFEALSTQGVLDKSSFDLCVRRLIPGDDLDDEDKSFLSFALSNVFYSYDRTGNGYVDTTELASGFTLFASGSKSEKLLLAFQAFDRDSDGLLSKRGLWKYLRSFLTVLLSLVESMMDAPMTEVERLVDNGAVQLTEAVFSQVVPTEGDLISFEEFAEWYTNGGFEEAPWLELLDLSKWPFGATSTPEAAVEPEEAAAPVGRDEEPVFEFPLSVDGPNDEVLAFYQSDVDNLRMVVAKTKIHTIPPAIIHEVFQNASTQSVLDKTAFYDCVRRLVPGNDLDDEDKSWLSSALSNVFYSYDRTGNGYVDATELASGFTLFASGSKSEKLLLAFQAFDKDSDGLLSKRGLWKYLRSFLTVLLSLVEGILDVPMVEVERLVDNGAVQLTETVFADVDPTEGGQISFEEFAEWYTNGGFEVAPWLELLDLSKWPFGATAAASSAASASNAGAGAPVGEDDAVFEFPLTLDSDDNSNVLSFYESDVDNLHAIVGKTQLHSQPPARLHEVFSAMSEEGVIDKPSFDLCVRRLIPGDDLDDEDKSFLSFALSNVFYSYDRTGNGYVDATELASGFTLFASGSKSEKLLLAFQACDDDNDGLLSKRGLWKYLRSFLTVLLSLVEGMMDVPMAEVERLVDNGSVQLTEAVFAEMDPAEGDLISFEEFAEWYTNGGFEVAPWLELLDLSKWGRNLPLA